MAFIGCEVNSVITVCKKGCLTLAALIIFFNFYRKLLLHYAGSSLKKYVC